MSEDTTTSSAKAFDTLNWPDLEFGIASPEQLVDLDGLEQLRAIPSGALPAPPIALTMKQWISALEVGKAEFRGDPSKAYLNPMGILHGGWTMTLLDSVLGCAIHTTMNSGETYVSLGTEVKFVKPVLASTGQVRATAEIITRGQRTATAAGKVEDQRGQILATGTTTCFIQRLK